MSDTKSQTQSRSEHPSISELDAKAALHEADTYGIGATSNINQGRILQMARAYLSQRCGRDEAIEAAKEVADAYEGGEEIPPTHRDALDRAVIKLRRALVSAPKERGAPSEDAGPV